jgi:GTP-binding protein
MLDGKDTYTTADEEIAQMLRRSRKPILLVVNKVDKPTVPDHFYDYYNLGLGEPFPISSANLLNFGDLLDEVVALFPEKIIDDYSEDAIKVAVIGKPNAGKSSLINTILGENRVIVSDIAGTTRDAIDTPFTMNDQEYVLIDTAGIRRRKKINESIEHYSVLRAITAIERSDVSLLVIDAVEGVTEQDKKIAGLAHEAGRGVLILVNKWDLVEKDGKTMKQYTDTIRRELAFMPYASILFVSALTKQRVNLILERVAYISDQASMRVQTGLLNDILNEAIILNQPPSDKGKRLKIYYMTQVGIQPPTFVLFVNDKELAHFSYIRYLENVIRKNFKFEGTPIQIQVREKQRMSGPRR